MRKKVGILTGGGDAPGLNAVIHGVTLRGEELGFDIVGIRRGWQGLLEPDTFDLTPQNVEGIQLQGGTILGTSRTNPFKREGGPEEILANIERLGLHALIAVGGEDTLGVANKLFKLGAKVVGVPKTIDNDLSATDFTFGFQTAVSIAAEAIEHLHTTARSHERVVVVEVMGRHAGWLTLWSGLAGGAHAILIPEVPFDIDELCDLIRKRYDGGAKYAVIAASEGATPVHAEKFITQDQGLDEFGHVRLGGIGEALAKEIQRRTGCETRHVVLGHLQRGGPPVPYDRVIALMYGHKAAEMVESGLWGKMAALRGTEMVDVPLEEAVKELKLVPPSLYEMTRTFFG